MTKRRRNLTCLQKVRIFDAHRGICHVCETKIQTGQPWDVEHVQPLYAGGRDDLSNMAPAHKGCHIVKSARENGERSKTTRIRANHLGIPKPRKAKLPAGRDSRDRKKLNGEVVPREARYEKHWRVMEGRTIR